jgi:hypothetical protein
VALAGVEAGSAHLGEIPARAEVSGAPFDVGLKATRGENDGARVDPGTDAVDDCDGAVDSGVVGEQLRRAAVVQDPDARLGRDLVLALDEPGAATNNLDREPTPEPEPVVDLERLAAVCRCEPDAVVGSARYSVTRCMSWWNAWGG